MKLTSYKIVLVEEFEIGDFLCHSSDWDWAYRHNMCPQFFVASESNVRDYSSINGEYYKIITNNKSRRE